MSELTKARLNATYAWAKQISHSDATGEFQHPVTLSGSDAAVNVALWPKAMHITLDREYACANSQPFGTWMDDPVRADKNVLGAIEVLNALVAGLDEAWLEKPGVLETDEPLDSESYEPYLESSNAESAEYNAVQEPASITTTDLSYSEVEPIIDSIPTTPGLSPCINRFELEFRTRGTALYPPPLPPVPCASHAESSRLGFTDEYKFFVCETFVWVRQCVNGGHVGLAGLDAVTNVGLYPRILMPRNRPPYADDNDNGEYTPQPQSADQVVHGAIEKLNALVGGIACDWLREKQMGCACRHDLVRGYSDSASSTASSSSDGSSVLLSASSSVATRHPEDKYSAEEL